jgi:hypothetical protein
MSPAWRRRSIHILTWPGMACFLVVLLALQGRGQEHESIQRVGMPHDWTHRHVIFSQASSPELNQTAERDHRFLQQQMRFKMALGQDGPHHADRRDDEEDATEADERGPREKKRVDWSVTIAGPIAPGMFPAKYTFDVNATPSCNNDFVVFALNVNGSSTVANIIAYNNLYTEPGGTGLCPGTGPTVMWAYNVGSAITTSPVLSLDGRKVAWAANSAPPVFHVLTIGTTGNNGTAPTLPAVPGVGNNAVDTAIPYGSVGNTRSSVFENYDQDAAYVGSNDGFIHKFSGVFNGVPAEVTTGWPIQEMNGARILTGPVFDSVSKNIFFADSIGGLSFIREVGSTKGSCNSGVPPCIGNSIIFLTNNTPITDPPIVDSMTQRVFAFAASNNTNTQSLVFQTDTAFGATNNQTSVGHTGNSLHVGSFDNKYFSSPAAGFLYVCGYAATAANPTLYRIGFDSVGNMNKTTDGNSLAMGSSLLGSECSPLTEIFNTPTAKDWLFGSVTNGCLGGSSGLFGCMMSFDITNGFPGASSHATQTAGGTSGIVVDNVSTSPQASNIYFVDTCGILAGSCAVKLTQSGLQ